ncbi:PREDICTED: uncharacterized protein LOC107185867 [Dufourea novaeangliae]|uniref:Uncharacterized protein n=1 Tax=Dufourea novaeangliae TaxID=178035 RepID=A0A154P714_DUFNO|nr:PREDICTED: uncharacterized protein LOC107185867 [Dufourea novaeangliae]KZC07667.1 hypothetical protein WN55_08439 [Dufourea novaeangliae]
MAVASGAMYNTRTVVPSFMSSNIYYGYVPTYKKECQLNPVLEHEEVSKMPVYNSCTYGTAMETDDDGCDYSMASCYLNNDSVILEASAQNRLRVNDQQRQCQQQASHDDADTLRRRNRKRSNGDHSPVCELKKFREGSGNNHVHQGTRSTKDYGLAKVSYEPELLLVNTTNDKDLEQASITNKSCCLAAGNHNLLSNTNNKYLVSSSGFKSFENNDEYETILFETHGCSIYHLHRLQMLDSDCTETEF